MEKKDFWSSALSVIFTLYIIIAHIMALIFFIGYCKTDSIAEIIIIDPFIAGLKGLLWIFFIW